MLVKIRLTTGILTVKVSDRVTAKAVKELCTSLDRVFGWEPDDIMALLNRLRAEKV